MPPVPKFFFLIFYLFIYLFYYLMKHAPSLESNTTCCKVGRECRTCHYPGAVAAFPVHSFL